MSKQSYHKPEFRTYGDIKDITLTVDNVGANDGGMSAMTKT
jgi:hypothetical protein